MITSAISLGDRSETALLVLAGLFLFCFLPLMIVGFIIYRVIARRTRNGSDDALTLDPKPTDDARSTLANRCAV